VSSSSFLMMKDLHGVNVVMLFALEDVNYGVKSFTITCMYVCMYVWH
jgi:hypothetical protein